MLALGDVEEEILVTAALPHQRLAAYNHPYSIVAAGEEVKLVLADEAGGDLQEARVESTDTGDAQRRQR